MGDREVRLSTILTEAAGRDRGADDLPGDGVASGGPQAGRLPNLVIVGVSRAGTTSLFNYLGQHPDVGSSEVKELRYFTAVRHGQALEPLASYAAHFRGRTQTYAMEATPGYFRGGHAVASALDETCPSARALVCLRTPVDRCWSWFRFVKSRDRIPKDMSFGEIWTAVRPSTSRESTATASIKRSGVWVAVVMRSGWTRGPTRSVIGSGSHSSTTCSGILEEPSRPTVGGWESMRRC